mgnify:CR=1
MASAFVVPYQDRFVSALLSHHDLDTLYRYVNYPIYCQLCKYQQTAQVTGNRYKHLLLFGRVSCYYTHTAEPTTSKSINSQVIAHFYSQDSTGAFLSTVMVST